MLRPVAADDSERLTPTLSILQIALVQAETDGFASKILHLIILTCWTSVLRQWLAGKAADA